VVALSPGPAFAEAPWSPPVALPGASGYGASVVTTPAGHTVVAYAGPARTLPEPNALIGLLSPRALLASIGADGRPTGVEQVGVSAGRLATYGSDGIVVVGTRTPSTLAQARSAPVKVAFGVAGAIGVARAVPGTVRQQIYALAGGPIGSFAFVTGAVSGHRTRSVWSQRGGVLKRLLTIKVSERARGAAVAIGSKGDVLLAWEDQHKIRSRHIGPSGHAGPAHVLGAGVQSSIQARYDERSQRLRCAGGRQRLKRRPGRARGGGQPPDRHVRRGLRLPDAVERARQPATAALAI
jgi:hypothetical protein